MIPLFLSEKKLLLHTAAIFLLAFIYHQSAGQLLFPSNHKRYVIKTINIENGLQNNTVGDIITDTFGFTWVATKTGLQRYNGYRLETVEPIVNGQLRTIDYQVYFLQTGKSMVWITCREGMLQYNPFLDKFSLLIRVSSSSSCPLRPLEDTPDGVWCAGEKGLLLYAHDGRLIKEITYPQSLFRPSQPYSLRFHCSVSSSYLFLMAEDNAIIIFNKSSASFSVLPVNKKVISGFTSTESKLYVLHKNGITIYRHTGNGAFAAYKIFYQNNRFLGTVNVFGNNILAGVDQHLLLLDSNCVKVNEITTLNSMPLLSVGAVKTIYEDQFNRLWLLTNNDIKVILNYTVPFQYFAYNHTNNFSKSIYVDEDKHLVLAGYYDGGIQLYDTLNNPLWQKPLLTDKVKDIAGIEKLSGDEYLITTIGQGLYALNLKPKKITPIILSAAEENRLHTHSIIWTNNIQRTDSNNIIISTSVDVIQCRFQHTRLTSAKILFHDVNKQIFYFYLNKTDNDLWVATSVGLLYCKRPDGSIDTLSVPGNYQIRCLVTDKQNNIWVGTDKGLFVYNDHNKLINTFTTRNGLLNDCIYSMLTDKDEKTIYASSNLGLSAVVPDRLIKNYTKERGLQENEFNSAATAKTSSGKLFFGGVNGITAFYPSDITVENDHPSLIIYKTDVNDKPFRSDSAVWNSGSYHLTYSQSKIAFSLAAFGIYPASDYMYEYRMNGFDKYWTSTSNPVNISYHLPPGTYQFQARLVNVPALLISRNIVVASPFWERWWFYSLLFFFIILSVWLSVRALYRRKYKAQVQMLYIRQQVLAERERISRDLHDNIGAYASAISANVDDVIYQSNPADFTTLYRLRDSAREIIVQLRDSIWALNKENQTVIMLSDRIKNYIQKLQPAYPAIVFDVEEDIEQNAVFPSITALHVLRIVQEAVHNAIKHSGCSAVKINISSCSPVTVTIEDNGRGLPGQFQYGEGLKNMQIRAAEIGWQVSVASTGTGCLVLLRNTN